MRFRDVMRLALSALWKQKLRSALTLLGVIIGTATLAISLSIGKGLRKAIDDQFSKEDSLRQIEVFPSFDAKKDDLSEVPQEVLTIEGETSDERRERLRDAAVRHWRRIDAARAPRPLTKERIRELAAIEHVVAVHPSIDGVGRAYLGDQSVTADLSGIAHNHRRLSDRLQEGSTFSGPTASEVIVHEFLLYRWKLRGDAQFAAAVGSTVRVEVVEGRRNPIALLNVFGADASALTQEEMRTLEQAWTLLPQAIERLEMAPAQRAVLEKVLKRKRPGEKKEQQKRVSGTFTLVGVIRSPPKDDRRRENEFLDGPLRDAEILLPLATADALYGKLPSWHDEGYSRARVIVDHESNLKSVVDRVKQTGLNEYSLGLVVEQIKLNVQIISFGMNFIALIALVVAAVGITNTLFTSVLERTREIGMMKAVGAKDRHVQGIFLVEGALIGLVGGLTGLLLAWLASLAGDGVARELIAEQTSEPPPETMFLFPPWLIAGVPLFAVAVTTLAASLPARRAARIHPVEALRYE